MPMLSSSIERRVKSEARKSAGSVGSPLGDKGAGCAAGRPRKGSGGAADAPRRALGQTDPEKRGSVG
jgi:hypothetical protein